MRHGSVTIFLCVLLSVLVPLTLILTDLVRLRIARVKVDSAVRLAAESILADYERPLRDQYGVLGVSPRSGSLEEAALLSMLRDNLEPVPQDGYADPFGLRVQSAQVTMGGPLQAPDALAPQLAEYMRYRAPVSLAAGWLEKLRSLAGASRQAACVEAEMALERTRALARENLVYLFFLKETRLDRFGRDAAGDSLAASTEFVMKTQTARVGQGVSAYRESAAALAENLPRYRAKQQSLSLAAASVSHAEDVLSQANAALAEAKSAWELAGSAAASSAGSDESAMSVGLDGSATSTGSDESTTQAGSDAEAAAHAKYLAAMTSVSIAESALASETRAYGQEQAAFSAWCETQWQPIANTASQALRQIGEGLAELLAAHQSLSGHLFRQGLYLEKACFLATGLTGTLAEVAAQTADAAALADSVSGQLSGGSLSASASKKPAYPDEQEMDRARQFLAGFRERVAVLARASSEREQAVENTLASMTQMTGAFDAMARDPAGPAQVPGLPESVCQPVLPGTSLGASPDLKVDFSQAWLAETGHKTIDMGQPPSEQERAAYWDWFAGWSGEPADTADGAPETQDANRKESAQTLRAIREAAGITSEGVRKGEENVQGGVIPESLREVLPSALLARTMSRTDDHPLAQAHTGSRQMDETHANDFTQAMGRMAGLAGTFDQLLSQSSDALLRVLWEDAYMLAAFTNATTPAGGIPGDIAWGRKLDENVFKKGEVEYILFGQPEEGQNLLIMKGALFGTRLALNLLHIHASAAKRAATLSLATTLAGWTAFGIPAVQHFLMLAWAAAESCTDVDRLLKGMPVPVIKTDANWFLSVGSLRQELVQNLVLDPLKGRVAGAAGAAIGKADQAVRETVGGWIDAAVDGAFAPLEIECADFGSAMAEQLSSDTADLPAAVSGAVTAFVASLPQTDPQAMLAQGFSQALAAFADSLRTVCAAYLQEAGVAKVVSLREQVKAFMKSQVFASACYANLVEYAKTSAMGLTNRVFEDVSKEADKLFGPAVSTEGFRADITARMATMDYQEYLALFLLLVPPETKTARAADLMQLNLQRALQDASFRMGDHCTQVRVEATVVMSFWFLPDDLGGTQPLNVIQAAWETGY
jgi:hypothetical protein